MLAPSAQIACAEHPECLCGAPGNLVTASRKGSRLLQSAFWEAGRGCFPPPGATFSALSNVRISLSACHADGYGFPLPFFGASRAEGRNKRFSRIGQVKVSKCKGREDSAPIQTKTPAFARNAGAFVRWTTRIRTWTNRDSNLDKQNQNLLCYHYTIVQTSGAFC